jgi:hypothetical protein
MLVETGHAANVQVAVDPNGNATAVWGHDDNGGTESGIWSNRYTPTTGWGTRVLVVPRTVGFDSFHSELAADPNGNVTVISTQDNGADSDVVSNRFE